MDMDKNKDKDNIVHIIRNVNDNNNELVDVCIMIYDTNDGFYRKIIDSKGRVFGTSCHLYGIEYYYDISNIKLVYDKEMGEEIVYMCGGGMGDIELIYDEYSCENLIELEKEIINLEFKYNKLKETYNKLKETYNKIFEKNKIN